MTTLFGSVFFLGPVMVHALLDRMRAPREGETGAHAVRLRLRQAGPLVVRRLRRVLPALVRAAVYGGLVLTGRVLVVLPYWRRRRLAPARPRSGGGLDLIRS